MENASDALKMAFAVFVFVVALSIVFSLVAQIKETADTVLYYADKTNYYDDETGEGIRERKNCRGGCSSCSIT